MIFIREVRKKILVGFLVWFYMLLHFYAENKTNTQVHMHTPYDVGIQIVCKIQFFYIEQNRLGFSMLNSMHVCS